MLRDLLNNTISWGHSFGQGDTGFRNLGIKRTRHINMICFFAQIDIPGHRAPDPALDFIPGTGGWQGKAVLFPLEPPTLSGD